MVGVADLSTEEAHLCYTMRPPPSAGRVTKQSASPIRIMVRVNAIAAALILFRTCGAS
jgi:hypothetical protein